MASPTGRFSVSAATVTVNDVGEVLLIRRADNGRWDLPGGVVELGEHPPTAAVRETREETGVTVRVGRCTGVYTNVVRGIVAFVFRATPLAGRPRPSEESVAATWCTPSRALDLLPPVFATRLADALNLPDEAPVFRAHDGERWLASPVRDGRTNAGEASSR